MAKGKNKRGEAPRSPAKKSATAAKSTSNAGAAKNAGGKRNRMISKRGRTVNPCREPRHKPRYRGEPVLLMDERFKKRMIFVLK